MEHVLNNLWKTIKLTLEKYVTVLNSNKKAQVLQMVMLEALLFPVSYAVSHH